MPSPRSTEAELVEQVWSRRARAIRWLNFRVAAARILRLVGLLFMLAVILATAGFGAFMFLFHDVTTPV